MTMLRWAPVLAGGLVQHFESREYLKSSVEQLLQPLVIICNHRFACDLLLSSPKKNITPLLFTDNTLNFLQTINGVSSPFDQMTTCESDTMCNTTNAALPSVKVTLSSHSSLLNADHFIHEAIISSLSDEVSGDPDDNYKKFYHYVFKTLHEVSVVLSSLAETTVESNLTYPPFRLWVDLGHSSDWLGSYGQITNLGQALHDITQRTDINSQIFIHASGFFPWHLLNNSSYKEDVSLTSDNTSSIVFLESEQLVDNEGDKEGGSSCLSGFTQHLVKKFPFDISFEKVEENHGYVYLTQRIRNFTGLRSRYLSDISDVVEAQFYDLKKQENGNLVDNSDIFIQLLNEAVAKLEEASLTHFKSLLLDLPASQTAAAWRLLDHMCHPELSNSSDLQQPPASTTQANSADISTVMSLLGVLRSDSEEAQQAAIPRALALLRALLVLGVIEVIPRTTLALPLFGHMADDGFINGKDGDNFYLSVPPPIATSFLKLASQSQDNEVIHQALTVILRWEELADARDVIDNDVVRLGHKWEDYCEKKLSQVSQLNNAVNEDIAKDGEEYELLQKELSIVQLCSSISMRREAFKTAVLHWQQEYNKLMMQEAGKNSEFVLQEEDEGELSFLVDVGTENRIKSHILDIIEARTLRQEDEIAPPNQRRWWSWFKK